MFEFFGVIFLGIIFWVWITSDELSIKITKDGKEIFNYYKKDDDDEEEKNNKKDLK